MKMMPWSDAVMRFFMLLEKHMAVVMPPWEALHSCWPVAAS